MYFRMPPNKKELLIVSTSTGKFIGYTDPLDWNGLLIQ